MDSKPNLPRGWVNLLLGFVLVVSVLVAAVVFYNKDLKPRLSAEQQAVNKSYTFTLLCKVQQPILGIQLDWLIGRDGFNSWTYNVACLVESKDDIVIISNNVPNLLPEPAPGLHFLVIADSAPVSIIDWEKEWRDNGVLITRENVADYTKLTSYTFSHKQMRLYPLYLLPKYLQPDTKIKVLCREAIEQRSDDPRDWRPFHLCSSN